MNKLLNLRTEIDQLNNDYFNFLNERQKLICSVVSSKLENNLPLFDSNREFEIFQKHREDLKKLPLEILLSYSLLIESQVNFEKEFYPRWSQRVHLNTDDVSGKLYEQINPILLKAIRPELFSLLHFIEKFKYLNS